MLRVPVVRKTGELGEETGARPSKARPKQSGPDPLGQA